eukprot:CAMPEP_0172511872 /NCGR_PEP_ID=MMETSP1066-20121228/239920_1 /TAXON_ID=671091 /ORGANISM="Coscinodiscus wailesii, Strain CCMP2513" /LENGTH=589 /DNA_ID=CAMNT_0013291435 /DNA_START=18 /DNA_END=1787 /DNA_ORIENTATION=-
MTKTSKRATDEEDDGSSSIGGGFAAPIIDAGAISGESCALKEEIGWEATVSASNVVTLLPVTNERSTPPRTEFSQLSLLERNDDASSSSSSRHDHIALKQTQSTPSSQYSFIPAVVPLQRSNSSPTTPPPSCAPLSLFRSSFGGAFSQPSLKRRLTMTTATTGATTVSSSAFNPVRQPRRHDDDLDDDTVRARFMLRASQWSRAVLTDRRTTTSSTGDDRRRRRSGRENPARPPSTEGEDGSESGCSPIRYGGEDKQCIEVVGVGVNRSQLSLSMGDAFVESPVVLPRSWTPSPSQQQQVSQWHDDNDDGSLHSSDECGSILKAPLYNKSNSSPGLREGATVPVDRWFGSTSNATTTAASMTAQQQQQRQRHSPYLFGTKGEQEPPFILTARPKKETLIRPLLKQKLTLSSSQSIPHSSHVCPTPPIVSPTTPSSKAYSYSPVKTLARSPKTTKSRTPSPRKIYDPQIMAPYHTMGGEGGEMLKTATATARRPHAVHRRMTIIPTASSSPSLSTSSYLPRKKEERDESRVGGTDHDGDEIMTTGMMRGGVTMMASSVPAVVTPGSSRSGTDRSFFPPGGASSTVDRECF